MEDVLAGHDAVSGDRRWVYGVGGGVFGCGRAGGSGVAWRTGDEVPGLEELARGLWGVGGGGLGIWADGMVGESVAWVF